MISIKNGFNYYDLIRVEDKDTGRKMHIPVPILIDKMENEMSFDEIDYIMRNVITGIDVRDDDYFSCGDYVSDCFDVEDNGRSFYSYGMCDTCIHNREIEKHEDDDVFIENECSVKNTNAIFYEKIQVKGGIENKFIKKDVWYLNRNYIIYYVVDYKKICERAEQSMFNDFKRIEAQTTYSWSVERSMNGTWYHKHEGASYWHPKVRVHRTVKNPDNN